MPPTSNNPETRYSFVDIPMRLVGTARSTDLTRHAADRRRDPLIQRCTRRILGLFTVEQACTPSPTA